MNRSDEGSSRSPEGTAPPALTPSQRFGRLLRDYREALGLSQRKLAALLEIDDSTVQRLEAGTRKPPRDLAFYERLRRIDGITEAQVLNLLRTDNAPAWLVTEDEAAGVAHDAAAERPAREASAGGIHARLRLHADPGALPEEELPLLEDIVGAHVEIVLRGYLRERTQLRERIEAMSATSVRNWDDVDTAEGRRLFTKQPALQRWDETR